MSGRRRATGGVGRGLSALGGFADRVGLTDALSAAAPQSGERAPMHDRGVMLTHGLLTAAWGGEACSDIEHLRAQHEPFGEVASDSALYRVLTGLGADGAAVLLDAAGRVREQAWAGGDRSGPLAADIDSALAEVRVAVRMALESRGGLRCRRHLSPFRPRVAHRFQRRGRRPAPLGPLAPPQACRR